MLLPAPCVYTFVAAELRKSRLPRHWRQLPLRPCRASAGGLVSSATIEEIRRCHAAAVWKTAWRSRCPIDRALPRAHTHCPSAASARVVAHRTAPLATPCYSSMISLHSGRRSTWPGCSRRTATAPVSEGGDAESCRFRDTRTRIGGEGAHERRQALESEECWCYVAPRFRGEILPTPHLAGGLACGDPIEIFHGCGGPTL